MARLPRWQDPEGLMRVYWKVSLFFFSVEYLLCLAVALSHDPLIPLSIIIFSFLFLTKTHLMPSHFNNSSSKACSPISEHFLLIGSRRCSSLLLGMIGRLISWHCLWRLRGGRVWEL